MTFKMERVFQVLGATLLARTHGRTDSRAAKKAPLSQIRPARGLTSEKSVSILFEIRSGLSRAQMPPRRRGAVPPPNPWTHLDAQGRHLPGVIADGRGAATGPRQRAAAKRRAGLNASANG